MMSQILLINGLINLVIGGMIYFNIHEFKMCKKRMICYFLFGGYFIFSGFLRLKVAFLEGVFNFSNFDIYNQNTLFAAISCISNAVFVMIVYDLIKIERKC